MFYNISNRCNYCHKRIKKLETTVQSPDSIGNYHPYHFVCFMDNALENLERTAENAFADVGELYELHCHNDWIESIFSSIIKEIRNFPIYHSPQQQDSAH